MDKQPQQLDINPASLSHEIVPNTRQAFLKNESLRSDGLIFDLVRALEVNTLTVSFRELEEAEQVIRFYASVGCKPIQKFNDEGSLVSLFIPFHSPLNPLDYRIDYLKVEINKQNSDVIHILDTSLPAPYHSRDLIFAVPRLHAMGFTSQSNMDKFMQKITTNPLGKNSSVVLNAFSDGNPYYMRIWSRNICLENELKPSPMPKFTTSHLPELED